MPKMYTHTHLHTWNCLWKWTQSYFSDKRCVWAYNFWWFQVLKSSYFATLGFWKSQLLEVSILLLAIYVFNAIPIKIPMTFIRDWKIYPKVHLETQETTNSQGDTQQKDQCWRYHNIRLQTILQSISNKNMVLAEKQTWRPVEQNRGPKYESHIEYPHHFWQRCQNYTMEKRQPLKQMLLGKVVIRLQKTETRSISITLY
jgi:hypothetical protein